MENIKGRINSSLRENKSLPKGEEIYPLGGEREKSISQGEKGE